MKYFVATFFIFLCEINFQKIGYKYIFYLLYVALCEFVYIYFFLIFSTLLFIVMQYFAIILVMLVMILVLFGY